jgi:hypothetical protein
MEMWGETVGPNWPPSPWPTGVALDRSQLKSYRPFSADAIAKLSSGSMATLGSSTPGIP